MTDILESRDKVEQRISPFTVEEENSKDGEFLMEKLLMDQDTAKEKALKLQVKFYLYSVTPRHWSTE